MNLSRSKFEIIQNCTKNNVDILMISETKLYVYMYVCMYVCKYVLLKMYWF